MITIHHLDISRSERIVWLMEELALPYELKTYDRQPSGMAHPDLAKIHPLGQAPIIEDDGKVVAESGAIIEYIANRYGGGRLTVLPSADNYADYLYWLHFAEGSLMAAVLLEFIVNLAVADARDNRMAETVRERTARAFRLCESRLCKADYFAGDEFTVADIMMLFPFTTMRGYSKADLSPFPAIQAYIARIESRPAYQGAMKLAGPARDRG